MNPLPTEASPMSPSPAMDARICAVCNAPLTWEHDHRADNTGLDDGPPLRVKRKKPVPKTATEFAGAWGSDTYDFDRWSLPTHWMPLPSAPPAPPSQRASTEE